LFCFFLLFSFPLSFFNVHTFLLHFKKSFVLKRRSFLQQPNYTRIYETQNDLLILLIRTNYSYSKFSAIRTISSVLFKIFSNSHLFLPYYSKFSAIRTYFFRTLYSLKVIMVTYRMFYSTYQHTHHGWRINFKPKKKKKVTTTLYRGLLPL